MSGVDLSQWGKAQAKMARAVEEAGGKLRPHDNTAPTGPNEQVLQWRADNLGPLVTASFSAGSDTQAVSKEILAAARELAATEQGASQIFIRATPFRYQQAE